MINLMIIDDEETTRDSLLELIPWAELGVNDVRTAEDGLAALTLAESFAPSILLTDIRMSKMNGIEVSQKMRELYPNCVIIFLSGFSDKEYLKSAIQLNAVDYLEKPVNIQQLKSVFLRTVQKLLEDQQRNIEDKRLKYNLHSNIHLLRQDIVLELLVGNAVPRFYLDKYGSDILHVFDDGDFTVVCILLDWVQDIAPEVKSSMKNDILRKLNAEEPLSEYRYISGYMNDSLVIILNECLDSASEHCKIFWDQLFGMLLEASQSQFTFAAGCSDCRKGFHSLPGLYKASSQLLKQQFYGGNYKVFHSPPLPSSSYDIDNQIYVKFRKLLRSNSFQEAVDLIIDLTQEISATCDPDTDKIKNIYFKFLSILFEITMNMDIITPDEENENKYVWQEIHDKKTLSQLTSFLITPMELMLNKYEDKENTNDKLNKIKSYILDHYTDNQLSIQSIAAYTYLSQTYLCAYFKKVTGRTLNEFITELRIEKAKELVMNKKIKLYEVSAMIGFIDSNYFSTIFKKHTGLTPSEFRERR
ncbi:MAG: response regulator [Paenibacillaceae bacterium]